MESIDLSVGCIRHNAKPKVADRIALTLTCIAIAEQWQCYQYNNVRSNNGINLLSRAKQDWLVKLGQLVWWRELERAIIGAIYKSAKNTRISVFNFHSGLAFKTP